MKMTAENRTKDGRKHRKAILWEMKTLSKRIGKHACKHLKILTTRSHETDLTDRLKNKSGMREGLERLTGTEAWISILIRDFMGKPARAKGFAHRELRGDGAS